MIGNSGRLAGGPGSQSSILPVFKANFSDPVILYILFILSVPQGVLNFLSPYHFQPPNFIVYPLFDSPISLLFLPVVLFSFHHLVTAPKAAFEVRGVLIFWGLFVLWQPISIWVMPHPEPVGITWELFFAHAMAFSFLYAVAVRRPTAEGLAGFVIVWSTLQGLGAIIGSLAGLSAQFEGRINAPNLDIGATALLLGGLSFLLAVRPGSQKYLSFLPIPLQVMTGSRAPLVLTLFLLPFALATTPSHLSASPTARRRPSGRKILLGCLVFVLMLFVVKGLAGSGGETSGRMDFLGDPSQLQSDASTMGRLASIMAGLQVIITNPFGIPFSIVEMQVMMGRFGYPTFPHNNLLVWIILFGPFVLILIYTIIKYGIKIFNTKSPHRFCFAYFLIYSLIAGGIDVYLKQIFIYLIFFLIFVRSASRKTPL